MKALKQFSILHLAILLCLTAESAELLKKEADIPLPGGTTRFDYQSLDQGAGRLYFSQSRVEQLV